MDENLTALLTTSPAFSPFDRHFAHLMVELAERDVDALYLASALVSNQTRKGHVCVELTRLDEPAFRQELFGDHVPPLLHSQALVAALRGSRVVGEAGEFKPLILDEKNRLYLYRYWAYQQRLAAYLRTQAAAEVAVPHPDALRRGLQSYFDLRTPDAIDWQGIAALVAVLKKFCVVTGGPGTGKTYTVAKILALLIEQAQGQTLRIQLAAPTGKAAVRLQDAIGRVKREVAFPPEVAAAIPEETSTIHRLLGTLPYSPYFWHDENNPLELDVLVVDEASMVDLALMAKLVQALPPDARLLLLGDDNQLASVEAGAVLADICDTGREHRYSRAFLDQLRSRSGQDLEMPAASDNTGRIQDCIVHLRKSYRFEAQKGIGALSQAINDGDGERAFEILNDPAYPEVQWQALANAPLTRDLLREFTPFDFQMRAEELFRRLEQFRVLCAVREGPQGVKAVNGAVEQSLKKKLDVRHEEAWYPGKPILITQNDYSLNLFNGDVGIVLPDPENGNELLAHFMSPEGGLRRLRPFRLPEHETAYAMTVHKSQGSEFDRVMLLLPQRDTPLLTRELIYTGITRAAQSVQVWGNEEVFKAAVARRIRRTSGLRDALWG